MLNNTFKKPKKDFSFLMESEYVKKWIQNVKESEKRYKLSIMSKYVNFIEKNSDELILEHHKDLQTEPIKQTEIAKKQLFAYYQFLIGESNNINKKMRKNPISVNGARQYVFSKLLSFFKHNNVAIRFLKNEIPSENKGTMDKVWRNGEVERIKPEEKKVYLKQIRDTLPNIRDKAIFLCKLSSGLDDCDLFNLTYEDFKLGYFEDYNICYIEDNRQKTNTPYQTFFGSESCDLLKIYFKELNEKGFSIKENDFLFTSLKTLGRKIKSTAFSESLKKTCVLLNIKNVTPKTFRRWFNTTLKQEKVDYEIIEIMLGHTIGVSRKYQEMVEDVDSFAEFYYENCDPVISLGNGGSKLKEVDKNVLHLEDQVKTLIEEKQDLINEINQNKESMKELKEKVEKHQEIINKILNSLKK